MFKKIIAVSLLLLAAAAVFGQTPEKTVRDVYAVHLADLKKEGEDRIVNGQSRQYLDRFFDKTLADLIWKDMTTVREGVGVIDFDIFFATQDEVRLTNFRVWPAKITGDRAEVRVTYNNWKIKSKIVYLLARQTDRSWKISDIKYDEYSLMKYFRDDEMQK
ncbi:MAG: DUF3828 domain-containing protein [Acidobacteria bacterium]|nr:DUF3828 domain-containing protein [Acidobacteriota bacterium]